MSETLDGREYPSHFGDVVKWKDTDGSPLGPERARYMVIQRTAISWGSGLGVNVICLTKDPRDEWEVGDTCPCDLMDMEVVH